MAGKPLKSNSFDDLNSASFGAGEEDEGFVADMDDDDLDGGFVSVDLNEEDVDKAIESGFGKSREDDDDDEDGKGPSRRRAKKRGSQDDDLGDGDEKSYSKKVRKRIERERKVSARERQARINAERERDELRERVGKIESRFSEVDEKAVDDEIQGYARELDDLEAKLAKANEDGEHSEVAKLTRRMQEVSSKRIRAEERKEQGSQARKRGGDDDDEANRQQQQRRLDPRAEDFIAANSDWWDDDAYKEDRLIVMAIDDAVHRAGFKPDTDEYYVELARRARERGLGDLITLPDWISEEDLEDDDDKGKRKRKPQQRRRRLGGPGGMGSGGERGDTAERELRSAASGKVTLTSRDFKRMRAMRMDPENKEHLRYFAEAKRESARQELQNRG